MLLHFDLALALRRVRVPSQIRPSIRHRLRGVQPQVRHRKEAALSNRFGFGGASRNALLGLGDVSAFRSGIETEMAASAVQRTGKIASDNRALFLLRNSKNRLAMVQARFRTSWISAGLSNADCEIKTAVK